MTGPAHSLKPFAGLQTSGTQVSRLFPHLPVSAAASLANFRATVRQFLPMPCGHRTVAAGLQPRSMQADQHDSSE